MGSFPRSIRLAFENIYIFGCSFQSFSSLFRGSTPLQQNPCRKQDLPFHILAYGETQGKWAKYFFISSTEEMLILCSIFFSETSKG
jgi:hypothetical protein